MAKTGANNARRKFGLTLRAKRSNSRRPDGGVVTQRIANPRTPVRFRVGPPESFPFILMSYARRNQGVISHACGQLQTLWGIQEPVIISNSRPKRPDSLCTGKCSDGLETKNIATASTRHNPGLLLKHCPTALMALRLATLIGY